MARLLHHPPAQPWAQDHSGSDAEADPEGAAAGDCQLPKHLPPRGAPESFLEGRGWGSASLIHVCDMFCRMTLFWMLGGL